MSVIYFSQKAWSYEFTEKYFFQGLSKYKKKYILILHNLCTSEITYAVPNLS
jgi:hypothetical protein